MCYIHQLYLYFELTRKFDLKKQSIRIKGPKSMHVLSQHIKISTRSQFCLAKKMIIIINKHHDIFKYLYKRNCSSTYCII